MLMILYSAIAGICGTGVGGFITVAVFKNPSARTTSCMLMFAAGVMTSIVCFGLVPEAMDRTGVLIPVVSLILGVIIIMLLNRIVDKITDPEGTSRGVHETPEELYHESEFLSSERNKARMIRSGMLMIIAIGLHNIPEGLAIGAGGSLEARLGIVLAIMIALHNIPEGMAIAAPLSSGGIKKLKVIGLTSLSGAPTLVGGAIGVLVGGVSEFALSISLAVAGGAMLYVVFGEIIPQSIVMTKSRLTSIVALFGILVGLLLTLL